MWPSRLRHYFFSRTVFTGKWFESSCWKNSLFIIIQRIFNSKWLYIPANLAVLLIRKSGVQKPHRVVSLWHQEYCWPLLSQASIQLSPVKYLFIKSRFERYSFLSNLGIGPETFFAELVFNCFLCFCTSWGNYKSLKAWGLFMTENHPYIFFLWNLVLAWFGIGLKVSVILGFGMLVVLTSRGDFGPRSAMVTVWPSSNFA